MSGVLVATRWGRTGPSGGHSSVPVSFDPPRLLEDAPPPGAPKSLAREPGRTSISPSQRSCRPRGELPPSRDAEGASAPSARETLRYTGPEVWTTLDGGRARRGGQGRTDTSPPRTPHERDPAPRRPRRARREDGRIRRLAHARAVRTDPRRGPHRAHEGGIDRKSTR